MNARTVLIIHWGFLLGSTPQKNPTLQVLHFLAAANSHFFHGERLWVGTPNLSKKNATTEVA